MRLCRHQQWMGACGEAAPQACSSAAGCCSPCCTIACPAPPPLASPPPAPFPYPVPHSQLFKYYHERLPTGFPFPAQPPWKAGDSPEHEEEEEAEGGRVQEDPHAHKHHDDVIGEQVGGWEVPGVVLVACGRATKPSMNWSSNNQTNPPLSKPQGWSQSVSLLDASLAPAVHRTCPALCLPSPPPR